MNKAIEEAFVKNYIVSSKRERLLFELCGKKRSDGINRFCHRVEELLMPSRIRLCGTDITNDLQDKIATDGQRKCYVISYNDAWDGKEMDKNNILELMIGYGMPSIAIFEDFAIIETEQEQGPAKKYLLQK